MAAGLTPDAATGELVGSAADVARALDAEEHDARLWIEGLPRATDIRVARAVALVAAERPDGRRGLLRVAAGEVPVVLVARLGLRPCPPPDHPPVVLEPGAMAQLLGTASAHGHGLAPELAAALQARLDRGIRHWSVRLEARGGALRRNVEVVDGDGGIWRGRLVGDRVELAPTTSTEVLRAVVALARQP